MTDHKYEAYKRRMEGKRLQREKDKKKNLHCVCKPVSKRRK